VYSLRRIFALGERLEIDHIIPKSCGGKDNYENLKLLHRICHVGKTRDYCKAVALHNLPLISVPDLKLAKSSKMQQSYEYTLEEIYAMEGF